MLAKDKISQLIDAKKDIFTTVSDQVWENPELGFLEFKSAGFLMDVLKDQGFEIETGLGEIETAFKGTWGKGKPVIGFLGEFDALPSLSQKAGCNVKTPLEKGGAGHGCGHNALGAGSLASAVALKDYLQENNMEGTVVYFGCPGEEAGCGKAFMAREGAFDCIDVALTWHPGSANGVMGVSSLANICVLFHFKGVTSHAAASPHLGRSALDAAELMSVGVNYLREHIIDAARIHYAYHDVGGGAPNVVQDSATVFYYIRAPKTEQVNEIFPRVAKVAKGAAMMTETELTIEIKNGLCDYIPNDVLSTVMGECNLEMGGISFSEEAKAIAAQMRTTFTEADIKGAQATLIMACNAQEAKEIAGEVLVEKAFGYTKSDFVLPGSTDVGDVSYVVPTAQMNTSCVALGTPSHSWQYTAQTGGAISHEGLLYAGKVMAYTALKLIENPELIEKAKAEHKATTGGVYNCPIPKEVKPRA